MNKDYTLADLLRSLHSLWTYTWCSSEFNKANTTAIRKKQYSQLQSHSHFHSHLHSQLEQVEQEKLHYDWALECPLQQVDKFKDKTRKIGEILETKFIDTARTATGNSMDDMVFQYNNQNSIYVLNANYSSYEIPHFGVINTAEQQQTTTTTTTTANNNNNSNNRSSSKFQKIEDTAKSLQQKLKILEKEHFYDIATDAIGNPITSLMSSATSATAATAVIQKLINCSNNVDNTFADDNSRSNNNSTEKSKDSKKGTFANVGRNAIASCSPTSNNKLSTVMSSSSSSVSAGCASSGGSNGKKKFNSIKPTLIAKKTKFWKFLEEEKARSQEQDISNGNLTRTSNCEQCMSTTCQNNTNGAAQSPHNSSANNESLSRSRGSRIEASPEANEPQHHRQQQQQKVNSWSGNHDSSNNQPKQQQRSSYELYKEAAELLGLSCTLCDNCRCLDCQSGYFDCDDSDSYSDFSIPDDYEYGYEETLPVTAHEMALIMHANAENECGMMDGVATFAVSQTPSRTNTVDITSANYVRGDGGEGGEAAAGAEVVGGPTNAGDMHVNMGGVCYCRNGKCMEPHTNELHSTDNSSRGFNITSVHAQTVSRQDNDEISSSSSSMNSTLLERSPSSRAVINTVNSLTREDSQRERVREQQQQQQQQQEQEKPCEHCSHFSHQREEHQYPKHQPEGNEAKNCASLNNLNVPATKGNGSASSHQRQSNCKN